MVTEIKVGEKTYYMNSEDWKRLKAFRYYKENTFPMSFEEWYDKIFMMHDESLS